MTELERKVNYKFGYYDEGVTLLTDKIFYGNIKNQDGYSDFELELELYQAITGHVQNISRIFNTASVFSDDKGNSGMCSQLTNVEKHIETFF